MKAAVYEKYGPPEVLKLKEVPKPEPKQDEVLVKIEATTVTAGDAHLRQADFFIVRLYNGLLRPKRITILGFEFAGRVAAVGKKVSLFKEGDEIFASTGFRFKGYAEYITIPETGILAPKPSNMTFAEAAAVPIGGTTALSFLRKGGIEKGHRVLIYGASGSVGTFAVQLAKYFGAEVTGLCSTANIELVRSLGADKVIDYTCENFAVNEKYYDIILDAVGKSPFSDSIRSLKDTGKYLRVVHMGLPVLQGIWVSMTSRKKVIGSIPHSSAKDLIFLKECIEAGKIRSVIDKHYSLEQIVEAHRHVDTGHKKGNVAITIA